MSDADKRYYIRGRCEDGTIWACVDVGGQKIGSWSDSAQQATPVTRELGERLIAARKEENHFASFYVGRMTLVDVADRPQ